MKSSILGQIEDSSCRFKAYQLQQLRNSRMEGYNRSLATNVYIPIFAKDNVQ